MRKLGYIFVVVSVICGCGGNPAGVDAGGDNPPNPPEPVFPCDGDSDAVQPLPGGEVRCFDTVHEPDETPSATIEHAFELYEGVEAVHIRLMQVN